MSRPSPTTGVYAVVGYVDRGAWRSLPRVRFGIWAECDGGPTRSDRVEPDQNWRFADANALLTPSIRDLWRL